MRPCERAGTHRLRIAASDTSCSRTEEGPVEVLLLLSEHSSGQRLTAHWQKQWHRRHPVQHLLMALTWRVLKSSISRQFILGTATWREKCHWENKTAFPSEYSSSVIALGHCPGRLWMLTRQCIQFLVARRLIAGPEIPEGWSRRIKES